MVKTVSLFWGCYCLVGAWSCCLIAGERVWPQFRGPTGAGNAAAVSVPIEFGETQHLTWKSPLQGRGWSSPVVWEDQIWVTSAIEHEATPEEREALLAGVANAERREIAKQIELIAICLDLNTGETLHEIQLATDSRPKPIHPLNSYASPTPVLEGDRLYAHFGTYGTFCLDTTTGDIVWRKRLEVAHYVGPGSSPIVHGERLILVCDGADVQYVAALDKRTGEIAWKQPRPAIRASDPDMKKAYATPLVISVDGTDQIVTPGAQWVVAYDPADGKPLWQVDHGDGFSNVPRPVFGHGLVYVCTGFTKPELWAIDPTGQGDVTDTHVVWKESSQISKKPSPLLVDDTVYVLADGGVLSGLDARTGETRVRKRLSGNYSASPLLAGNHIYLASQTGEIAVLRPGDDLQTVAVNRLTGQLMASPCALPGTLLVRSDTHLYRFDQPSSQSIPE